MKHLYLIDWGDETFEIKTKRVLKKVLDPYFDDVFEKHHPGCAAPSDEEIADSWEDM